MEDFSTDKIDEYYQALLDRNAAYTGVFYVGVKTTSIFCIATCRARKPKKENVVFYRTYLQALQAGFRPCKICCPTENAQPTPASVVAAIQLVKDHPKEKISDQRLRAANISPDLVRRWFKKTYHMTFHAFQRMYRINQAYKELKEGKTVTQTAFDAGYESLSGFGYTYKKLLGKAPKGGAPNTILLQRVTTPLGPMFMGATEQGICLLEFVDRVRLETELSDLQRLLQAKILLGNNQHSQQLKEELAAYFKGERQDFEVALHMLGTAFQQEAWNALLEVPYGTTSTYSQQARTINRPKAVRAIANANGGNRISIVIPCHRIIGKDGQLRGYGGGLERKQWLLDFERTHKKASQS